MMKKMIKMMKLYYLLRNTYPTFITYDKKIIDKHIRLPNNAFISQHIVNQINQSFNKTFHINYGNINLYIVCSNNKCLSNNLISDMISRIIVLKSLINNKKPNNIYLWPTSIPKKYPTMGNIIGVDHVNSAMSYINPYSNGDIYIWRQEELLKVLTHEMLHSLRFDYFAQNKQLNDLIQGYFNVNNYINANEAYTEALATILHCMFLNIENGENMRESIRKIINEVNYSHQQINKLLIFNGFDNLDELKRENCNIIFAQNTSVFSYYILKTALLDSEDFHNFIINNGLKYPKNGNGEFWKIIKCSFDNMIENIDTNNILSINTLKMTKN